MKEAYSESEEKIEIRVEMKPKTTQKFDQNFDKESRKSSDEKSRKSFSVLSKYSGKVWINNDPNDSVNESSGLHKWP